MKRLLRLALVALVIAVVVWLLRDRLVRVPQAATEEIPHFRPRAEPPPPAAGEDDLTEIVGIGPVYARRLAEHGITTFAALADADSGETAEAIRVSPDQVADWSQQARARA